MNIYDMVGIGFGPAGIALAAALDDYRCSQNLKPTDKLLFLESQVDAGWQRGLLFRNADIQHHYLRDLATPRDPRSRFTFANFLKQKNRLFEFGSLVYGGGGGAVSRIEWSDYVAWAAGLLDSYVRYNCRVEAVRPARVNGQNLLAVSTPQGDLLARSVSFCAGQEVNIPVTFQGRNDSRIFHATQFLNRIAALPNVNGSRIAVVGAGQAAIEVTQYLHNTYPEAKIHCVQRAVGYQHGNHSPFVQRMFHPHESDLHFRLTAASREKMLTEIHRANYAAVDREAVSALYRTIYEDKLTNAPRINMVQGVDITAVHNGQDGGFILDTRNRFTGEVKPVACDIIVLATGFLDKPLPSMLEPLVPLLTFDELEHPVVSYDYALQFKDAQLPPVYIPGAAEYSHGLGSSNSFSMLALKAERVANALTHAGLAGD